MENAEKADCSEENGKKRNKNNGKTEIKLRKTDSPKSLPTKFRINKRNLFRH